MPDQPEKNQMRSDTLLNAPVYRRIEEDLRVRIRQGKWPVGTQLPSRKDLAREYDVDLTTLQRAIAALLEDGTLRAQVPQGTFVAKIVPEALPGGSLAVVASENREAPSGEARATPLHRNTRIVATLGIVAFIDPRAYNWDGVIVDVLERAFAEAGGITCIVNLLQHAEDVTVQKATRELLATGVDAVALVNIYDRPGCNEDFLAALNVGHTHAMIVCWEDLDYPVPHVFYDNRYAGYQAADHLITCGYRPLAFVAPFTAPWAEERLAGALRAAHSRGSGLAPLDVLRKEPVMEFGADWRPLVRELALAFFAQPNGKDTLPGIIAPNDEVAALVLRVGEDTGKKAGVDFGLVGFNDDVSLRGLGITTLRPPLEDLGREAARNLVRLLQGDRIPVQIRLQSQLIPRGSTAHSPGAESR